MTGLTPTLAVKFLINGRESVNLLANTSFDPSRSFNFFSNDFRTIIPNFQDDCLQDTIGAKFIEATREIGALGLSEFARWGADGQEVNTGVTFPFNLWFEPNEDLKTMWPETRQVVNGQEVPFYEQLQQIDSDFVLFSVMA